MKDLSDLLDLHSFTSTITHIGSISGVRHFSGAGYLHLIEKGQVKVHRQGGREFLMDKPSLIFFPDSVVHHLEPIGNTSNHVVSACIQFSAAAPSLVLNALPQEFYIELGHESSVSWTAKWLLEELRQQRFGKSTMIDRLGEMFILQVLRYASEHGQLHEGTLRAINHPQLSKIIYAIHSNPAHNWTLESLAELGAMSRSKFAETFKAAVGQTPNNYVISLRVSLAQKLLKKDKSINFVAYEVGYEHGSALARIFKKKLGVSPSQWLQIENNTMG